MDLSSHHTGFNSFQLVVLKYAREKKANWAVCYVSISYIQDRLLINITAFAVSFWGFFLMCVSVFM